MNYILHFEVIDFDLRLTHISEINYFIQKVKVVK